MSIETALLPVRRTIASVGPDTHPQEIAAALGLLEALGDAVRSMRAELKANMLEWVTAHGDLTIGTTRYYAGTETDVKCIDVPGTFMALLETTDLETTAACLSASAWKVGATAKALPPDVFAKHFIRTVRNVLADGKPRRALLDVDTRFVAA